MKQIKLFLILSLLMTLFSAPIAIQAEDDTPPTPAEQVQETTIPATTSEAGIDYEAITSVVGQFLLVLTVGGSLALAFRANDNLKLSVPDTVVDNLSKQIVTAMKETMNAIGQQVIDSPNPYDDALFATGKIPIQMLLDELDKRAKDPDNPEIDASTLVMKWDNTSPLSKL